MSMPVFADFYISGSCGDAAVEAFFAAPGHSHGIGLELGFSTMTAEQIGARVAQANRCGIPLLAHNYWYPFSRDLVLNLSDPDPVQRKASLDYAVASLDYCAQNNIAAYSIHAGFACSFLPEHFGQRIASLPAIPLQQAYDFFVDGLRVLTEYAALKTVALLFENNVVTRDNLADGCSRHLLCAESEGIVYVLSRLGGDRVGVLLDLGHLKISAASLCLSPQEQVRLIAKHVGLIHVHDNDAQTDLHLPATPDSWFWPLPELRGVSLVVEQPGATLQTIAEQLTLFGAMRFGDAH